MVIGDLALAPNDAWQMTDDKVDTGPLRLTARGQQGCARNKGVAAISVGTGSRRSEDTQACPTKPQRSRERVPTFVGYRS
jgi:hypothetical protein